MRTQKKNPFAGNSYKAYLLQVGDVYEYACCTTACVRTTKQNNTVIGHCFSNRYNKISHITPQNTAHKRECNTTRSRIRRRISTHVALQHGWIVEVWHKPGTCRQQAKTSKQTILLRRHDSNYKPTTLRSITRNKAPPNQWRTVTKQHKWQVKYHPNRQLLYLLLPVRPIRLPLLVRHRAAYLYYRRAYSAGD